MSFKQSPDGPVLVEIRCGGKNGRCGTLLGKVHLLPTAGGPLGYFLVTRGAGLARREWVIPPDLSGSTDGWRMACRDHGRRADEQGGWSEGVADFEFGLLAPKVAEARRNGATAVLQWLPW